jgi:VanZ family protein
MLKRAPSHWLRTAALTLLLTYWAALAIATHWPRAGTLAGTLWDKLVHALAYGVLALLVCFNVSLRARGPSGHSVAIVAILAVYAALDEVTQIPFGRRADVYDWTADLVGVLVVLAIWFTAREIRPRRNAGPKDAL